ncbi:CCA tRNA nucleotidyltransferase [Vagococcus sp. DIV0080]|uniref:CCA-adding enzyme n=1 Tax=Candidatus Vagococcus giribetii TaxID=2230876 RepID=A0ABS3HSW7_9ENTE|nr:CCA tRNA nucleotidyltransferase [Vagococcus sp. DIV0080]MBO0476842.1 CCA tRNA nucleotidyltransferase [Vagococcus sp. DIV0080]
MKMKQLPEEFLKATPIMEAIEAAGFEAYFVGGSVRDIILNHHIHDVDIATSAFPEEIKQIFPRTVDVGIEHGTVLVLHGDEEYEITTFRTESTYQDYRRPDEVTFVRSLSEDLKRRDFTMNALAMTKEGELIDLFSGIEAIHQKQIIAVGNASERFHEDALRMMRGLRFTSQLDFDIEEQTKQAIMEHHALLEKISVERIYIEFIKLLTAEYRNKGLVSFVETGCFNYCPGLKGQQEGLEKLLTIPNEAIFETDTIAWITLIYMLHINEVTSFLRQWKCSNKLIHHVDKSVTQLIRRDTEEWDILSLYESGEEVISDVEIVRELIGLSSQKDEALNIYKELPIKSIRELAVSGKDILNVLEESPGPWLGQLLGHLEKSVVLAQLPNEKEALLIEGKKWKESH